MFMLIFFGFMILFICLFVYLPWYVPIFGAIALILIGVIASKNIEKEAKHKKDNLEMQEMYNELHENMEKFLRKSN